MWKQKAREWGGGNTEKGTGPFLQAGGLRDEEVKVSADTPLRLGKRG